MATVFGKKVITRIATGWFHLQMGIVPFYQPGLNNIVFGFHPAAATLFLLTKKIAIISVMTCVPVSTLIYQRAVIFARGHAGLIPFPNRQLVPQVQQPG